MWAIRVHQNRATLPPSPHDPPPMSCWVLFWCLSPGPTGSLRDPAGPQESKVTYDAVKTCKVGKDCQGPMIVAAACDRRSALRHGQAFGP